MRSDRSTGIPQINISDPLANAPRPRSRRIREAVTEVTAEADNVLEWKALPSDSLPGALRLALEQRLGRLGLLKVLHRELVDDLHLVTSELVTNAGAATPDDEIVFKAAVGRDSIWLGAWDSIDEIPTEPAPARELSLDDLDSLPAKDDLGLVPVIGGWGLGMIAQLTGDRGISATRPHGKWVWARFWFTPRA